MIELKKWKRSGLLSTFLLGTLLVSTVPGIMTHFQGSASPESAIPLMAMLNGFILLIATVTVYQLEFSNGAIAKMQALSQKGLFLKKFGLIAFISALSYLIQGFFLGHIGFMAQSWLLTLPMLSLLLLVSSLCKNLWTAIGIGMSGIFAGLLFLNLENLILFPFVLPFRNSLTFEPSLISISLIITALTLAIGARLQRRFHS